MIPGTGEGGNITNVGYNGNNQSSIANMNRRAGPIDPATGLRGGRGTFRMGGGAGMQPGVLTLTNINIGTDFWRVSIRQRRARTILIPCPVCT
jgi:hypothetical protein